MGESRRDVWDLLTLGAWFIFFAVGLAPEFAFYAVRDAAQVRTSTALVNSSAIITLGFAAYVAFFAFRRCRDTGLSRYLSQGKALEVGLIALVAFLELPARGAVFQSRTLVLVLLSLNEIPDRYLQAVVLFVGASKLLAWSYLLSLTIRYHAFGNRRVFSEVPSLFPSMHLAPAEDEPDDDAAAPGDFAPPDEAESSPESPPTRRLAGK